jgi:hypothetical protein
VTRDDYRDALIYMPGAIRAEQDTVQALVQQLDADVCASHVGAQFRQAWAGFVAEWQHFYDAHASWWSRTFFASYEKTLDYRRRLVEWRDAFQREGGAPTGPAPSKSPTGDDSHLGAYLAIGAGAIAGGLLLGWWASSKRPERVPAGAR